MKRRHWTTAIPADVLAASGLTRADLAGAEPGGARQHAPKRPRAAQGGAEGVPFHANRATDAAEARTARPARDVSDDEWAGTGPKGRYPVPLQYTLWLAGWLCGQEGQAMLWVARHRDGRVVSAATCREMVEQVEGL